MRLGQARGARVGDFQKRVTGVYREGRVGDRPPSVPACVDVLRRAVRYTWSSYTVRVVSASRLLFETQYPSDESSWRFTRRTRCCTCHRATTGNWQIPFNADGVFESSRSDVYPPTSSPLPFPWSFVSTRGAAMAGVRTFSRLGPLTQTSALLIINRNKRSQEGLYVALESFSRSWFRVRLGVFEAVMDYLNSSLQWVCLPPRNERNGA